VPYILLENVKLDEKRSNEVLNKLAHYHPFLIMSDAKWVSPVPRKRWFWTNIPPSFESPEETQISLPFYGEEGKEVDPVTGAIARDWLPRDDE
jgi:hypothetical protein